MHLNFEKYVVGKKTCVVGKSCLQRLILTNFPCIWENNIYDIFTCHATFSWIPQTNYNSHAKYCAKYPHATNKETNTINIKGCLCRCYNIFYWMENMMYLCDFQYSETRFVVIMFGGFKSKIITIHFQNHSSTK